MNQKEKELKALIDSCLETATIGTEILQDGYTPENADKLERSLGAVAAVFDYIAKSGEIKRANVHKHSLSK